MNEEPVFSGLSNLIRNQYCDDREMGDAIYKKSNETINGYLTLLIAENRRILRIFAFTNWPMKIVSQKA